MRFCCNLDVEKDIYPKHKIVIQSVILFLLVALILYIIALLNKKAITIPSHTPAKKNPTFIMLTVKYPSNNPNSTAIIKIIQTNK